MNRMFEPLPQSAGMFGSDPGNQHALFLSDEFRGDADDLGRRFARTKDDFRETLPQGAVRVHLGETDVRHRRGLKGVEHLVAAHPARAEFFQ